MYVNPSTSFKAPFQQKSHIIGTLDVSERTKETYRGPREPRAH